MRMSYFVRRIAVIAAIALTHVSSISTRSVSRSHYASSKSYSTSCARLRPLQSRRPDDFIEAEIVSQTDSTPNGRNENNQKIEILGADKRSKRQVKEEESGGIFNRLATFFGQDEESRLKKERKKKLNSAIDKVFEGSGALGTVFGSLAKGIGGMVAGRRTYSPSFYRYTPKYNDSLATSNRVIFFFRLILTLHNEESLYAANADLEVIQSSVINKLEADGMCRSSLLSASI